MYKLISILFVISIFFSCSKNSKTEIKVKTPETIEELKRNIDIKYEKISDKPFWGNSLETYLLSLYIFNENIREIKMVEGNVMLVERQDENNPRSIYIEKNKKEIHVELDVQKTEESIKLGLYGINGEVIETLQLKIVKTN